MASKIVIFSVLLTISVIDVGRADETSSLTETSLAQNINQFGCNLLNGLYSNLAPEDNLLVSPVNAYSALALLHLGAAGKTLQELSAVMKVPKIKNSTEVHQQLNAVLSKISPPPKSNESNWGTFHETKLANGIFLGKGFSIKAAYEELAKKYYNSSAENLDFNDEPEKATDFINKWISDSTKGRINKFYAEPLSPNTVAVLVSALYFNAKWRDTFPLEDTKLEKFNTGLKEIEVPMMNKEKLMYYSNDNTLHYACVSLLYSGKEHEMTIYLQHTGHGDHGSLAHLFHKLAEQNFAPNTTETTYRQVNLKIPKMKFSWKNSVVSALNLEATFNSPNLDVMTPSKNVEISNMIHATELEVDENGTIASAVTAIEMAKLSLFIPEVSTPVNFHVNRPYLATITHRSTGTILFAGIIRKPSQ